ncbi:metalloregulator ArsR/SmtB family transcription factor [Patescibacteria group bacterium]|nr:metalloregulator ArsR/SmtB family transcription factor [Patescibacteria group bacterium]MBU1457241.1 metalloregulator ArsR/SmtB family transcription factor [Patescibacteria group bacterium]
MNICSCNCDLLDIKSTESLLAMAKTLSTETKLKILLILLGREHCVCEIQNCLEKEQSLVSHHLSDLVETDWIKQRKGKDARQIFYSLTKDGLKKLQTFLKAGGVKK